MINTVNTERSKTL